MKAKLIYLILLLLLIFPTFGFFLSDKMFTFNDETQIINLHHYFKTIDLGQFPPRWATEMHFEYGSPFPEFNYQLPYYLGYLGHLVRLPNVVIFKLLLVVSVIIGATGMFLAGSAVTGSLFFALFAGVLYAYTPYQAIDHFIRGSLGEVYALAFFPWIFWAGFSLTKKDKPAKICLLGLLLALLIISHQPAALLALPLFAFIFVGAALVTKKFTLVISYLKSFALALLLSAYYWMPVILEMRYIKSGGPFNYYDQFPFIRQLIYSPWKYAGASPFSTDTFSFQIGLVNLFILGLSLVYLLFGILKRAKTTLESWVFRLTLTATFVAIFLMNIRSDFIWRSIGLLREIQFPWRLLMFTTWFTPLLFLFMVKSLNQRWVKPLVLVLILAAIGLNVGYFHPGQITDRGDRYYEQMLLPRTVTNSGETISADYLNFAEDYAPLPKNALRPSSLPSAKLTAQFKSTKIVISDSNPLSYSVKVDNIVSETLTFHTFNFPGWKVIVDNFPTQIKPNEIGAITFAVTPGTHKITIAFADTPLRLISNTISLSAILLTAFCLLYYLKYLRVTPTA